MKWSKEKFMQFVLKNHVIGFFKEPITLKSGRLSYWYVNWRNVAEDVFLIDQLSDYLLSYVEFKELSINCFYGVPEGATKLGVITQFKWAKKQREYKKNKYVLSMGRAIPKHHGAPKDKYFLGQPKGNVVVLEDTTTTGGSLIDSIKNLQDLGVNIIAALSLTNRNELREDGLSVKEYINNLGIDFFALSDALDLLPLLYKQSDISQEIAKKVEQYFQEYGVEKLTLL